MASVPALETARRPAGPPPDPAAGPGARNRGGKLGLGLLGLPTFGMALAITTVTTYLPSIANEFTSSTVVVGVIVAVEGLMALWLPLVSGTWSDRLRTRLGGRLPFLIAGTPIAAAALLCMGLVGSIAAIATVSVIFFFGYFIAYEPYRALYPDAVPDEDAGRSQSTQALWRGAGTGLSLLGGGLLLSVATFIPFVAAAAIMLGAVGSFCWAVARRGAPDRDNGRGEFHFRRALGHLSELVRSDPRLRAFLAANALWELSLGALKTFVFLYLIKGLGFGKTTAGVVIGVAALFILGGAVFAGKVGDRVGKTRVLKLTLPLYGAGLLVPFLVTAKPVLAAVSPFVAFGGGVIMALPYAVLMPLMPDEDHGALTGFYSLSRGVGAGLGPLLAGVAVNAFGGVLTGTHGYAGMWIVCSVAIFASLPMLRALRHRARDESR